jgi:hypothetical protein
MKLESNALIMDFDPLKERTEAGSTHNIGEGVTLADQRKFRYAVAGEAITAGYLAVAPTPQTSLSGLAVLTGAKGAQVITFTNAAIATIDTVAECAYFSEGYVIVSYGTASPTGIGQVFKIKNLEPVATGATGTVNLYEPIQVALNTASKIDIVQNTYNGVIMDVLTSNVPAGVSLSGITAAGDFGWLQTRGYCGVMADGTIDAHQEIVADGSTAGAVDAASETIGTTVEQHILGKSYYAGASGYAHAVFLRIE